jgi:hypothetical protein
MVQGLRRWLLDDYLSRKITRNIPNLKTKKEETIMKKNKMIITILGCMVFFLIVALLLVPAAQAEEKSLKYRIINRTTKMEWLPVPDVEKHVVGVVERRGVGIFEGAIFEKGETAAQTVMVTFDVIKGKGSIQGYVLWTFKDGSTFIVKIQGTKTPATNEGTGVFIKGTGRFEGIKGKLSFKGKYITPYTKDKTKGDAIIDATGTYTLPKK